MHFVDRRRTYAGVLLLAIGGLFLLSVGGAWWQAELLASSPLTNAQVQHVTISFNLGGGLSCSTWRWPPSNPCNNISGPMQGPREIVYAAANYIVGALGVAALLGAGLLFTGNAGLNFGRVELRMLILLVLAIAVVGAAVVVITVGASPGPQAGTYCAELSGNVTTCPIFFGSAAAGVIAGGCNQCDLVYTWGGGLAFYESVAATGAAAAAWWLLWVGRAGPFSRAEQVAWAVSNRPLALTGPGLGRPGMRFEGPKPPPVASFAPSATAEPPAPRFKLRADPWTCARCGRVNSPWAGMCMVCRGPPPPD